MTISTQFPNVLEQLIKKEFPDLQMFYIEDGIANFRHVTPLEFIGASGRVEIYHPPSIHWTINNKTFRYIVPIKLKECVANRFLIPTRYKEPVIPNNNEIFNMVVDIINKSLRGEYENS